MSEISKALALEESFEYEGRTYKLAPLTFEVIGLWELWLKRQADLDLYASKAYLPPDEYAERFSLLAQDKVAGKFSFFSRAGLEAMSTGWEGKIEFTGLRLAEAPANGLELEAARKLAREIQEQSAEAWRRLQEQLKAMDADPNPQAPPAPTSPAGDSSSRASAPCSPASPGTCAPGKSGG